jgi:hypothetical protein
MRLSVRACLALVLLCAAAAAGFASGDSEDAGWISGSGHVTTVDRGVPPFTAIELEGSGNLTIREGPSRGVTVETDENILSAVKTEVVGDVLHLGFKPGTLVSHMTRLEFTVEVPRVSAITISGSGNARTASPLRADACALDVRGSGSITAEMDVGSLQASIGGSGGITAKGRADRLGVTINGSGTMRARDLTSAFADVRVNGSGDATVYATNTLNISIAGSGSVLYGGGATPTVRSSGSGSVGTL